MSYAIMRFALLNVGPDYATKHIINNANSFPYKLIFGNTPKPPPGTREYVTRYRYTFSTIIALFLVYNVVESIRNMEPNFYDILNVPMDVDEAGLKLAFRSFARRFHPDKVKDGSGNRPFMLARDAFETLKDPMVRFAYDRFGPEVVYWSHCTTPRDYLRHGLTQSSGYHLVTGAVLIFWTAIGRPSPVAFWRYLLFIFILAAELLLIFSPSPSPANVSHPQLSSFMQTTPRTLLHFIFPQRIAYQHVRFLHQFFAVASVALTRIAPVLFPDPGEDPHIVNGVTGLLQRMQNLVYMADREATSILHTDLQSIQPIPPVVPNIAMSLVTPQPDVPEEVSSLLSSEMEDMMIEGQLRGKTGLGGAGPLKLAVDGAMERAKLSRENTPAGDGIIEATYPLPMSPAETPASVKISESAFATPLKAVKTEPLAMVLSPSQFGSPPPSPSPASGMVKRAAYVRGRSMSLSF